MNVAKLARRPVLRAVACAVLAVALPSAAQEPERPDDQAQAVAEEWAEDLLSSIRNSERRDEVGTRIALQPLEPKYFTSLDRRQRQQVYEWIRRAFVKVARGHYELVDTGSLLQIADVIESSGVSDWWEQYLRLLNEAKARVNVVCKGTPIADWITLDCSAVDLTDGASVGQAAAFFRLEWLNRPIALEFAIGRIASDIAERIGSADGAGRIKIVIVDSDSGGESALSNDIAGLLADAIHERARIPTDWIAVGTDGGGDARHHLDGEMRRLDDRFVLRVVHRTGEGSSYSVRENITLESVESVVTPPPPPKPPCGTAAEVAATVLQDGTTLSDWALLAEGRLHSGEYVELIVEARGHLRTFCDWEPAAEVLAQAVAGIAREIDATVESDPRAALSRVSQVLEAAGPQPALFRLKARAHRLLQEYSLEEDAYSEWLASAPLDHPDRLDVLYAHQRVVVIVDAVAAFAERVGRRFSADARDEVGWTDLHYVAAFDLPGAVAALIEAGMHADVRLETGSLPFGERLAMLLGDGFEDWKADGETPLMIAAAANAGEAMAELIAHGANLGAVSDRGATALHYAVWRNRREATELLLDHGADVDATDREGNTPLHHAAWEDARAMASFLIERGASLDAPADDGDTPLHHAAWQDAGGTAALLLDAGAAVDARDDQDATPLHHAAWRNAHGTALLLLDAGADADAETREGVTPLHHAAWQNALHTAELLLDRGAAVNAKDESGATALHRAAWRNSHAIAALLLDRGADVHAGNQVGATPLHYAARSNAPETMEILLAGGADADAKDDTGATPQDYAAEGEHQEALQLLLRLKERAAEDAAYERAKQTGTAAAYREYLRKYPNGRYAPVSMEQLQRAQQREDDEAFERARSADTVAAYAGYLRRYPNGRHVEEARDRHDVLVRQQEQDDKAFADAKAKNTSAAYAAYVKAYPKGRHVPEARRLEQAAKDNEAFKKAKAIGTSTAFTDYLRAHRNGRHVVEARRLQAMARDDEAFASAKKADTSDAYRAYLSRYSRGRHAGEARRLLAIAQDDEAFESARRADRSGAYRDYLRRYPRGRHATEARRLLAIAEDDEAWARAEAVDTAAAYATYLRAYPNGRHATKARQQRVLVEDDEAFAKAQESGTSTAYERYLKENPSGRHRNEAQRLLAKAEDDEAFALATEEGTSAAFDGYLKSHPRGRHVEEARRLRDAALRDEAEAERVRPGRVFLDCAKCPKMVVVPPGNFLMGSPANEEGREKDEEPVHRVKIPSAFAVGVHEITFEQWDYCTSQGGCERYRPPDGWNWGRGRRPVMDVSWDDAQNYVKWLSRQTGATYRLLSEAEWEYVARAGTTTPYSFGSRLTPRHANYGHPIGGRTRPVGSYRANRFGIYDVHGNLYEWVADCWHDNYHGAPLDGSSWQSGECSHRVVRGGSWSNYPQGLRSANRFSKHAVQRYADVGFRVARDLYP